MRISALFALILLSFAMFAQRPAQAGLWSDILCWFNPCGGDTDFTRPYMEDGKIPHNVQFDKDTWKPEDWIDKTHDAQQVMSGLYAADIITDQSTSWIHNSHEIEVGQGFMHLGGQDQRRVIKFVDYVAGYTKAASNADVLIYHKASGEQIGVYNAEGLQLQ